MTLLPLGSTGLPGIHAELHQSPLNVLAYGAEGDGVNDDTAAVQAAVDAAAVLGGAVVYIPTGTYLVTSTITIAEHRVNIRGDGPQATVINFVPTANDVCFTFSAGAAVLYQCGLRGVGFTSSDTTYTKTMVEVIDVSEFSLEDVASTSWTGANSIGFITHGRESILGRRLRIGADRPLVFADNPNSTIDIDLTHFEDCMFLANANPVVEVLDGVNLTSLSFDGYQSWVLGTYGFYWNDTTTVGESLMLSFHNVRTEQSTDTTKPSFHIVHNTKLSNLLMMNCRLQGPNPGMYFRKVASCTLVNVQHAPTSSKVSIDATSNDANGQLVLINCAWNSNSTKVLTDYISRHEEFYVNTTTDFPTPPENGLFVNGAMSAGDRRYATVEAGVRRFVYRGDITAGSSLALPNPHSIAFSGKTIDWMCRVTAHNATAVVHEYGVAVGWNKTTVAGAAVALSASTNFVVATSGTGTASKLSLVQSHSGQTELYNLTADDLSILLVLEFTLDSNL